VLKFGCCRGGVAHYAGWLITPGATVTAHPAHGHSKVRQAPRTSTRAIEPTTMKKLAKL
jgi:hypothetical protein